jgi:hypothetical protein
VLLIFLQHLAKILKISLKEESSPSIPVLGILRDARSCILKTFLCMMKKREKLKGIE